ncbi:MAG: LysM peptidoglycan-binding domain-containing protein, partial [Acidimicrobiales bacterium]
MATAAVVFGAVPAVLVIVVGLPVPSHWDRSALLSAHGLFDGLAVVAWVAWTACIVPLVRSVTSHVRRRDTAAPAGAHLAERLAVRMAAAVLALAPVAGAVASSAGAATATATATATAASAAVAARPGVAVPAPPGGSGPSAPRTTPASATAPATCIVGPGDSLWTIAARAYGHGADWQAIARANLGRVMVDGTRFVDPSLIRPGWVLELPSIDGTTNSTLVTPDPMSARLAAQSAQSGQSAQSAQPAVVPDPTGGPVATVAPGAPTMATASGQAARPSTPPSSVPRAAEPPAAAVAPTH